MTNSHFARASEHGSAVAPVSWWLGLSAALPRLLSIRGIRLPRHHGAGLPGGPVPH
jgi:hypothetical protein